jgi:hypothetical protein
MNIYTIHTNKTDPNPLENAVFIKEGFSIFAAVLQGFWSLYHKMWLCTAALIVLNISFMLLEKYAIITAGISTAMQIGVLVFVGFEANDWYRKSLETKGFKLFDIISGKDLDEAKKRFLEHNLERKTLNYLEKN